MTCPTFVAFQVGTVSRIADEIIDVLTAADSCAQIGFGHSAQTYRDHAAVLATRAHAIITSGPLSRRLAHAAHPVQQ